VTPTVVPVALCDCSPHGAVCLKFDETGSRLTIPRLEIVVKYINCVERLLWPDGHFCMSLTL